MNPTERHIANDIMKAKHEIAELDQKVSTYRARLGHAVNELTAARENLRLLEALRGILVGEYTPYLSAHHVQAHEDQLGMRIGPMMLAPTEEPTSREQYLDAVRAIRDAATHQIRLAMDTQAAEPSGRVELLAEQLIGQLVIVTIDNGREHQGVLSLSDDDVVLVDPAGERDMLRIPLVAVTHIVPAAPRDGSGEVHHA